MSDALFRNLIADDAYAMSFQSLGQYRKALLESLAQASQPEQPQPGKKLFAIACLIGGTNGNTHTFTGTLHTRTAETAEEAKGDAVLDAMKLKPGLGVHEVLCLEIEGQPQAQPSPTQWPEKCPITRRDFFMEIDGEPTYGGPFDSYSIPYMEGSPSEEFHLRELSCKHYDHDRGHWVEDESIPMRVIHETVLFDLMDAKEKIENSVQPAAQPAQDHIGDANEMVPCMEIGCGSTTPGVHHETCPEAAAQEPQPVGEIVLFGGDGKEVSWTKGKMPPLGAKLYTAPQADTTRKAVEAMREAARKICWGSVYSEMQSPRLMTGAECAVHIDAIDIDAVIESVRGKP